MGELTSLGKPNRRPGRMPGMRRETHVGTSRNQKRCRYPLNATDTELTKRRIRIQKPLLK